MTHTIKVLINPRNIAACLLQASKDPTRIYLNSVYVEVSADEIIYTATDGHRLLSIKDLSENKKGESFNLIIPYDVCKTIEANTRKERKHREAYLPLSYNPDNGIFTVEFASDNQISSKGIDWTYPDYRRTIPCDDAEPITSFSLNPSYYTDMEKAAKEMYGSNRYLHLTAHEIKNCIAGAKYRVHGFDDNVHAIIMGRKI